jgi:hypothetical protein
MLGFAFIIMQANAADMMITCATQPMDKKQWWSWRLIEGRQCWYPGKAMLPRNQLHWIRPEPNPAPFEQNWRDMLIDMYGAPWLNNKQPVSEWRIFQ